MFFTNIAGYKFIALNLEYLSSQREILQNICETIELKGTILLSQEGININLAGHPHAIAQFTSYLNTHYYFSAIKFRETISLIVPFKRLKVKIKQEIISFRQPDLDVTKHRAPHLSPAELKQWLDDKRDITLLDARNDYEIAAGTFKQATHLNISDFSDFTSAVTNYAKQKKPVVLFCTGGIRCEKAALFMLAQGHTNIYQLEGGILNYFAAVGNEHYEGDCFVFDDRSTITNKNISR